MRTHRLPWNEINDAVDDVLQGLHEGIRRDRFSWYMAKPYVFVLHPLHQGKVLVSSYCDRSVGRPSFSMAMEESLSTFMSVCPI
jgi:hypothetical protein